MDPKDKYPLPPNLKPARYDPTVWTAFNSATSLLSGERGALMKYELAMH
jgi:hypothetical protein